MKMIDANALAYKIVINGDVDFINKVTKLMIDVPSIDIVKCKECKKANTKDCSHSYWDSDWGEWCGYKGDDWFCADGERRPNEI